MKAEPLTKDKRSASCSYPRFWNYKEEDVKSAVEWLKEQINILEDNHKTLEKDDVDMVHYLIDNAFQLEDKNGE